MLPGNVEKISAPQHSNQKGQIIINSIIEGAHVPLRDNKLDLLD